MAERCQRCSAELAPQANYCARCGALVSLPKAEGDDPLLGRVVLGRYRVIRKLGEGGMGQVYVAEQAMGQATRPVALKALRKELMGDAQVSGRFLRESEIVIQLAHPNTIQFYDFGQLDDGTLVIVMEYIEGRTLAEVLRDGPLPLARIDALMIQICGSLAEAHARGIVHRDLKPQNILLTERAGQADFVKVVDFGIALRRGTDGEDPTRLTAHGTLVGTPPYMSPEQFEGRDVDARSDVYSLGVMLYQMITGTLPFEAKSAWQWAAAHLQQQPRPILECPAASALSPERAAAVMSALEKDPGARPADAGELLRRWVGGEAPALLPPAPAAADAAGSTTGPASRGAQPEVFLAPTLPAPLPATARRARLRAWLPLSLLVAAGIGLLARGDQLRSDAPALDAGAEARAQRPRRDVRAASARDRRGPHPRAGSASVAAIAGAQAPALAPQTEAEAQRGAAPPGDPDSDRVQAALAAAHAALDAEAPVRAADAIRDLRNQQADHAELPALLARFTEIVSAQTARLRQHGSCGGLRTLAQAMSSAGVSALPELKEAVRDCNGATQIAVDGGLNSNGVR